MASTRGQYGSGPSTNGRLHTELYARLHVARDASADEVKAAYRKLAAVYHPDKFNTEQMRDVAKENFQKIRQAFDVLGNPIQRQIYDIYGPKGVASGLELGTKLDGSEEIEAELERQQMRQRERKRAAHVNHAGAVLNHITLSPSPGRPYMSGLQSSTQVSAALSATDAMVLGSSMVTRGGGGGGTTYAVWKHQLSPHTSMEVLAMGGLRNVTSLSVTRQLSPVMHATSSGVVNLVDGGFSITNSWHRQLSPTTDAHGSTMRVQLSASLGGEASLGVGWSHQLEHGQVAGDIKVGRDFSGAAASYTRRLSDSTSARLSLKLGMRGVDLEVGGSRRLSEHSSGACSWLLNSSGAYWKIRYTRGGQKFVFLVCVTRLFNPLGFLTWFSLPSLIYASFKYLVLDPQAIRSRRHRVLEGRKKTAAEVGRAREEALHSQLLQSAPAQRRAKEAESGGGLVITGALYGNLRGDRGEGEGLPPPYLDVKVPLQFLVEDGDGGRLELHKGVQKYGLMGFCDPCPGEEKMLRVTYTWRGKTYKAVVGDSDELRIPLEIHRVYGGPNSVHEVD